MEGSILIENVYSITFVGPVVIGEVKDGKILVGMSSTMNAKRVVIKRITMNNQDIKEANIGDKIGLTLEGMSKDELTEFKGKTLKFLYEGDSSNTSANKPQGFFERLFGK